MSSQGLDGNLREMESDKTLVHFVKGLGGQGSGSILLYTAQSVFLFTVVATGYYELDVPVIISILFY